MKDKNDSKIGSVSVIVEERDQARLDARNLAAALLQAIRTIRENEDLYLTRRHVRITRLEVDDAIMEAIRRWT